MYFFSVCDKCQCTWIKSAKDKNTERLWPHLTNFQDWHLVSRKITKMDREEYTGSPDPASLAAKGLSELDLNGGKDSNVLIWESSD